MDKKLFELNENTTPADSKRLAFGDASSGAENITLANFYTRLMSKLGFLKVANYLNEYQGWPSAQASVHNSINVYSKTQVDDKDALKANKSNVIEKDSTTPYTPTLGTHPVNKSFIDNNKASGTFYMGTPWGTGEYTINIGKTMPSANYVVILMSTTTDGFRGQYPPSITDRTTTSFKVKVSVENDGILLEPTVLWALNML